MNLKPVHLVVLLLWCTIATAQQNEVEPQQDYVSLTLSSSKKSKTTFDKQKFNPNGIKLQNSIAKDELKLQFRSAVPDVTIEVIDIKGNLIQDYRGRNVSLIRFDTAQLTAGDYFIRVKSNYVQDFLKFQKQ